MTVPPPLQLRNLRRSIEANVPLKALRDIRNRVLFGPHAPRSDECLWVDPLHIKEAYQPDPARGFPNFRRRASGAVVSGAWDSSRIPSEENLKHQACLAHFRDGVPWERTGLFEDLMDRITRMGRFDGLRSWADIEKRYARLDALAQDVRRMGRLRARAEMPNRHFRREHGGVMVHIARDGTLLRAGGGFHRFALCQALGVTVMPVQLGVIHRDALATGILDVLRQPPQDFPLN